MSISTELKNNSAEEILERLLNFIPVLDESTEFILKYQHDFIFHHKKEFYNLALFSFHYMYMFILATSMVKYAEFKHENIKSHSGNPREIEGALYGRFGENSEKKIICHIPKNECSELDKKKLNALHNSNVSLRDDIAHASGRRIKPVEFDSYINNCFKILTDIQKISICKFLNGSEIKTKLTDLNNSLFESLITEEYDDIEFGITTFLTDYHISPMDVDFISQSEQPYNEIVFLLNYTNIEESGILVSLDSSENHYKSIYDWFHSKYTYVDKHNTEQAVYISAIKRKINAKFPDVNKEVLNSIIEKIKEESSKWVEVIS